MPEEDTLVDVLTDVTGVQPDPDAWVVWITAALALAIVVLPTTWKIARNVVTIAHEGGHALAALLTGRRLTGIRLHSDTSGVTVSRGKPRGPGMVLTAAAGYPTPALLGLAAAGLLAFDRLTALLWILIALLAGMLIMIRNLYGVLTVVVTGAILFGVSWFAPPWAQSVFAYFAAWLLLFAGLRPVIELQRLRRQGRAPDSDADQLARLTGVPALVWVGLFGLIAVLALLLGVRSLLD
jgi:hypothetical protein